MRTERRRRRGLALALLLALLAPQGSGALAQQDATSDAEKNMERGSEAMARGDFKKAVVFFRAAKELKPAASGPLLALGLALRANGECKEAVIHLEEYVRRKPQGDPKAKDAIAFCKQQLAPPPPAPSPLPAPPLTTSSAPLARQEATSPVVVRTAEPEPPRPIYKRWWFWTGIAVVVAGGVAGAVLATRPGTPAPAGTGNTGPAQAAVFGR